MARPFSPAMDSARRSGPPERAGGVHMVLEQEVNAHIPCPPCHATLSLAPTEITAPQHTKIYTGLFIVRTARRQLTITSDRHIYAAVLSQQALCATPRIAPFFAVSVFSDELSVQADGQLVVKSLLRGGQLSRRVHPLDRLVSIQSQNVEQLPLSQVPFLLFLLSCSLLSLARVCNTQQAF